MPEEVAVQVHALVRDMDRFLEDDTPEGREMEEIGLLLRIERLVINAQLPLPCSLKEAHGFLGVYDTSSLLLKGTDDR